MSSPPRDRQVVGDLDLPLVEELLMSSAEQALDLLGKAMTDAYGPFVFNGDATPSPPRAPTLPPSTGSDDAGPPPDTQGHPMTATTELIADLNKAIATTLKGFAEDGKTSARVAAALIIRELVKSRSVLVSDALDEQHIQAGTPEQDGPFYVVYMVGLEPRGCLVFEGRERAESWCVGYWAGANEASGVDHRAFIHGAPGWKAELSPEALVAAEVHVAQLRMSSQRAVNTPKYEYQTCHRHEVDHQADQGWRVVSAEWEDGAVRTVLMERPIEPEPEPVRDW